MISTYQVFFKTISGAKPPIAQFNNSTVCITGTSIAEVICNMQPIFPVAITSAFKTVKSLAF